MNVELAKYELIVDLDFRFWFKSQFVCRFVFSRAIAIEIWWKESDDDRVGINRN
jgi:hypothetical protein